MSDASSTRAALGNAILEVLRQWERWQVSGDEYEHFEQAIADLRAAAAKALSV